MDALAALPADGRVRYFGVLASHHHLRPRVVPGPGAELPGQQLSLDLAGRDEPEGQPESKAPRRIGWASLLARVFAVDVTVCRRCGGRMRILEIVDTRLSRSSSSATGNALVGGNASRSRLLYCSTSGTEASARPWRAMSPRGIPSPRPGSLVDVRHVSRRASRPA